MDNISCLKNLKLLWWLRNIAIIGQAAAIAIVTRILEIPLQENPLWLLVSLLAVINVATWARIKRNKNIKESEFFCQLLIDIAVLSGLLYFTGGATNPFASLFILQVIIAAITLSPLYSWIISGIAVALYTSLMFWNVEVPYFMHHHMGEFFSMHVQGMWINFILLAGIISWFVVRMNATIKRQESILSEAEKMAAIGTLAANSAHELGTPLATLSLLAESLEEKVTDEERKDKAIMFREQLARCKQILSRITAAGGVIRAEGGKPMQLDLFLNELLTSWKKENPGASLTIEFADNKFTPQIVAETGFTHAIINILDNAADASPDYVSFKASWTAKNLTIIITDKGQGIPQEVKENFGEPGVSSKDDGLGMGLFLSRSVITRLGGTLEDIESKTGFGTTAKINIPLARLVI
jgi:two-component system sensor histidine kinase RegB